jgi:hypothetical protein
MFLVLRRTERDIVNVKYRYSCQILMKLRFPRQIIEKYSDIKFHENSSDESRAVPCGQTDRRERT